MNLLQVACKDGYDLISLGSDTPSGIAECQNGIWNDTFICESMYHNIYNNIHSFWNASDLVPYYKMNNIKRFYKCSS